MRTTTTTRQSVLSVDQKSIAAVDKYFANITTLMLAGLSMTPAAVKTALAAEIDGLNAVDALRASLREKLKAAQDTSAKALVIRKALKAYVLGNYGASAVTMLSDFGLNEPKPGTKTVETKAGAVAKAKATRVARHTLGTKAKEAIKGQPATPPTPKA
jgi:hypothetical protein